MTEQSLDAFEEWWEQEVVSYAKEVGVSTEYLEDEFILEGELHKVEFQKL